MKKALYFIVALVIISLTFVSCETDELFFDKENLEGKWQSGTEYYRYWSNGTGITWDLGDDVTEAEGQAFTWTMVLTQLTHIHILEIGGSVPKVYTVKELTSTKLVYEDDFDNTFTFTKIPD